MTRIKKLLTTLMILVIATLACTSSFFATPPPVSTPTPPAVGTDLNKNLPPGDPGRGELLFTGQGNGSYACAACHGLFEGQSSTCPSIMGLAERAGSRIPRYSAEKYIWESIVSPDTFVVDGYSPGVMPQTFGQQMTTQDLADMIAFLMTK